MTKRAVDPANVLSVKIVLQGELNSFVFIFSVFFMFRFKIPVEFRPIRIKLTDN